jgi:hypothetical protein
MTTATDEIIKEIYGRDPKEIAWQILGNKIVKQQTLKTYFHKRCIAHQRFWDRTGSQWGHEKFDVSWCNPKTFESPEQAVDNAIDFCELILSRKISTKYNTLVYYLMRRDLPYQSFVYLVNRDYNPVGSNYGTKFSSWQDWPHLKTSHWAKWPRDLAGRSVRDKFNDGKITGYLFYDGNAPWHGTYELTCYRDRLLKLKEYI